MFNVFLVLLVIDALVLGAAVLLQAGQGGGLAAEFGGASSTDAFVGGRQAATLLTRASWWAGGIFLGLCFVLSLLSARATAPRSVLQGQFQQQAAPAPLAPLPLQGAAPTQTPNAATPAQAPAPRPAR
jgi:preprotein translocase subunit SecG